MTTAPEYIRRARKPRARSTGRTPYYAVIVGDRVVCCAEGRTAAEAIAEARANGWADKNDGARAVPITINQMRAIAGVAVVEMRDPTVKELERLLR